MLRQSPDVLSPLRVLPKEPSRDSQGALSLSAVGFDGGWVNIVGIPCQMAANESRVIEDTYGRTVVWGLL
jgi:hypothetical protein